MTLFHQDTGDVLLRARVEPLRRDHHGALLAHGLDRPSEAMRFFWQVERDEDYDGEREHKMLRRDERKRGWTLIALGSAKTRAAAFRDVARAMRDA